MRHETYKNKLRNYKIELASIDTLEICLKERDRHR